MGAIDPFTTVPATVLALDGDAPYAPFCDECTKVTITTALLAAAIFTACFFTGVALPITIVATVLGSIFLTAMISLLFFQTIEPKQISLNPEFITRPVISPPVPKITVKEAVEGVRTFKLLINAMFCTEGFFVPPSAEQVAIGELAIARAAMHGYIPTPVPKQGLQNEDIFSSAEEVTGAVNSALDAYINELLTRPAEISNGIYTPPQPRDPNAQIGTLNIDSSRRQVITLMKLTAAHIARCDAVVKCLTSLKTFIDSNFNGKETSFFTYLCASPNSYVTFSVEKTKAEFIKLRPLLKESLKELFPNMRTIATSFTGHCPHQQQVAFREYYDTKIETAQLMNTAAAMTLEQRMLSAFQKDRSQFLLGIIREMPECDAHRSSQESYYTRIFQQEFNLGGLPLEPSDLDRYATHELEARIRGIFSAKYTSQYILERAGELIGQGIPSDMVGQWLTEQYPATPQAQFLDEEALHYLPASLYLLLREHKILNAPA